MKHSWPSVTKKQIQDAGYKIQDINKFENRISKSEANPNFQIS